MGLLAVASPDGEVDARGGGLETRGYDRGAPLFSDVTQFGSFKTTPKNRFGEESKLLPDEKMPWPRYITKTTPTKWPIFDDFWLRSPVIQKEFHTKSAPSFVARVLMVVQS